MLSTAWTWVEMHTIYKSACKQLQIPMHKYLLWYVGHGNSWTCITGNIELHVTDVPKTADSWNFFTSQLLNLTLSTPTVCSLLAPHRPALSTSITDRRVHFPAKSIAVYIILFVWHDLSETENSLLKHMGTIALCSELHVEVSSYRLRRCCCQVLQALDLGLRGCVLKSQLGQQPSPCCL